MLNHFKLISKNEVESDFCNEEMANYLNSIFDFFKCVAENNIVNKRRYLFELKIFESKEINTNE